MLFTILLWLIPKTNSHFINMLFTSSCFLSNFRCDILQRPKLIDARPLRVRVQRLVGKLVLLQNLISPFCTAHDLALVIG